MTRKRAGLWAASALLVLAAAGAIALKLLVDPERLKEIARAKAREAWSRELTMGDIRFQILPLPSLRIRDLRLDHATEPPIEAKAVVVDLELLPLFIGKAHYRSIWVSEATITLQGAPWRIEEAVIESGHDMHDVSIVGSVVHNQKSVGIKAQFEDLSKLGKPEAASMGRAELDWGKSQLVASGRVPLDGTLLNHALQFDLKSESLVDVFEFFGLKNRPRAVI